MHTCETLARGITHLLIDSPNFRVACRSLAQTLWWRCQVGAKWDAIHDMDVIVTTVALQRFGVTTVWQNPMGKWSLIVFECYYIHFFGLGKETQAVLSANVRACDNEKCQRLHKMKGLPSRYTLSQNLNAGMISSLRWSHIFLEISKQ